MPKIDPIEERRVLAERVRIADEYEVTCGRITSPGKMESEAVYAPYFYSCMMNGDGEECGDGVIRFKVTPEERSIFGDLKGRRYVSFVETEQGFWQEV